MFVSIEMSLMSLSERHLPSGRDGRREPAGPERFGHGHQVSSPEQPGHRQQADRGGLLAGRGSLQCGWKR